MLAVVSGNCKDDSADKSEYDKEGYESDHTIHDVCKFHVSGVSDPLTYLYSKGYDYYNSQNIQKGDHYCVVIFCEPAENGVDQQHQCYSEYTYKYEMKHLVRETGLERVIQRKQKFVYLCYYPNYPI